MINTYSSGVLHTATYWKQLRDHLDPDGNSKFLKGLLQTFRDAGGVYYVLESAYIDRDFVRAYAAFYHRTHRPHQKHCVRLHVFSKDLSEYESLPPADLAAIIERIGGPAYVGCAVLRPVPHAPVSWAIVSQSAAPGDGAEILVRSDYSVHLLGAKLTITGTPVTEQDSRTGSCAQAAIWGAARHHHSRHGTPWHSVVDITTAALTPTDADIATSLPPGSGSLTRDAMVRSMKDLGLHPQVYNREDRQPWYEPPHRIISRYLDSGIPVIIGMQRGNGEHAVVAVGVEGYRIPARNEETKPPRRDRTTAELSLGPTTYDYYSHLLVNDDQDGPYRRLPIRADDLIPRGYGWCLENATFIMPTLPDNVFMRAEIAETIARKQLAKMIKNKDDYREKVLEDAAGDTNASFYRSAPNLVARTYLTHGWKYAYRMLRNRVPTQLKSELMRINLPKYVWVVEFSLPADIIEHHPCSRTVRAHVVVDPTGGLQWESAIFAHMPGFLVTSGYDPSNPGEEPEIILHGIESDAAGYFPKVRGWSDFSGCDAPPPDEICI